MFIQFENDTGVHRDAVGKRLPGVSVAVQDAARTAGSVLQEDLSLGRTNVRLRLTIEDEHGGTQAMIEVTAHVEKH